MKSPNTLSAIHFARCVFVSRNPHSLQKIDSSGRFQSTYVAARKIDAKIFDKSESEVIADIHARLSNGFWLKGTDAFRLFLLTLGLGLQALLT